MIVILKFVSPPPTVPCRRTIHATSPFLTVFIYLLAVVGYKYSKPNNAGLFSTESIATTIVDSYRTFVLVHPISVTSPMIAWSHIATYWFEVAAWRSRSIQGVLFWYLCYELIASYVNEHYHIPEEGNAVRCSRVAFTAAMKQYAVDDVVRAYLLPPFFAYLILQPNLLWEYISVYVLSIYFPTRLGVRRPQVYDVKRWNMQSTFRRLCHLSSSYKGLRSNAFAWAVPDNAVLFDRWRCSSFGKRALPNIHFALTARDPYKLNVNRTSHVESLATHCSIVLECSPHWICI
ncbi:TupA-like ATPgrasp [Fragilaria crotonensis]|nr:TupA-like ATPgrasp [Fragilaria crotonensis]